MSNTIMLVDAGDDLAVTWTKPDDWDVAADEAALLAVFHSHRGRIAPGTPTAFADGAVRFLKETVRPALIRALVTYSGGDAVSSDDL